VVALVARYGAVRVGAAYALDGDGLRRYVDGASIRTSRWWIELHVDTISRDLAAEDTRRGVLALVRDPSTSPGRYT
jgi:hypothetical protein